MPDSPNNKDQGPDIQPEEQTELPDTAERGRALLETKDRQGEKASSKQELRIATVVSIAAAVVSIVSAGYTVIHAREQERHNKRIELTSMIEKLVLLQDHPNDQYFILGRLAARLIDELPDEVAPPEYSIVARSLLSSGSAPRAIEYGEKAVRNAESISDKTWALRQLGWTYTQSGAIEKGRDTYTRALQIFHQNGIDEESVWVKGDLATTYADWGEIAAIMAQCKDANAAKAKLRILLPTIIPADDRSFAEEKAKRMDPYLDKCVQP
jgi:tetratricopeptide (TPR) repeat protein